MGIQINGNNDIISALDGSWTAEGASINTSGILTATTFEGNVTGTACTFVDGKFTGNVTIGGTLTYEDVTNIDSVGVITARAGINLTGGNITLGDSGGNSDDKLVFGEHGDLKIFHNGSNNYIDVAAGSGHLYIRPKNNLYIQDYTNGEVSIDAFVNGKTGLYYNGTQRLATSGIGATVFGQLDIESAGSYIKSNQLKFNPSGDAHIDHGTNNKDIYFRLSKSSALDTTMMQIDSSAEITKFRKYITVGLQGGADTAQLGGGSGVGAYLQLNYASGGIVNTKLLGNGNSWLNSNYGNLGIGTNNPTKILDVIAKDGVTQPYIEKQSGSTNNTYRSALTLSARSTGSAAANYGPAIGFQHCFGGSNYAGCQIASQCGSDTNTASIRFYPRNYGYTEAMRISHNGLVNIGAAADNTAIHASGPFSGATPKFEIKLGGAANSYKRLINITNPGAQTGSETLGRVGIKLSLGSEASGGESNKSGAIYAESTSGYNNGTALCLATANAERLRITSVGDMGLGTISPDGRLHISSGTANSDCVVIIEADTDNNDENANAQIWFKQDGDITGGFVGQSGNKLVISNNISSSGGISFRTGTTDNTGTTDPLNGATETLAITSDGKVGIGEDDPDGNKLLIRAGSTVGTNKGHIMLTGDSATNGQGPQIVFSESGSGSSYAGAYVGHVREGSNSTGALVFGTRGTGGDASTVPDERLRIKSTGEVGINEASNINGRLHVQHDAVAENILYATRYNDQGNDKPILAITEASMSTMTGTGLIIGNHNRHIHIGPVFDDSAAVTTASGKGIRIDADGRVLVSDDIGSTIPNQFPADNRQLMVYTSTNGQPIGNTACARVLIATDAKQTGAQGYHGSIDFGSSDCSASTGAAEFNWRTAAIMCRGDGDTSPSIADGDLQFWTKSASGTMTHRFDIAPNGDLTATDTNGIGNLSDQRLKTNIQDFTYDLNKFKQLKTKTFDWINPEFHREGNQRGFLAQEIETVDPYWNYQFEVSKETAKKDYDLLSDGDENYTIIDHRPGKASKLNGKDAMYVSVIQQLMSKIETLEAKVAALES